MAYGTHDPRQKDIAGAPAFLDEPPHPQVGGFAVHEGYLQIEQEDAVARDLESQMSEETPEQPYANSIAISTQVHCSRAKNDVRGNGGRGSEGRNRGESANQYFSTTGQL